MLDSTYTIKQSRKVNSWNALVQQKSQEVNEGRLKHDCVKLKEIQAMVREEMENGVYDKVEVEEMCKELEESREVKLKGARSSNRAAAVDYNATTRRIAADLANLHERCGPMGFAFVTRGHIHDTIVPEWIESQGSLQFINEVMNITPSDLLRKFEQWACAKDRTAKVHNIDTLRSECALMISGGLKKILGTSNVKMSYENYEQEIVQLYSVHLHGWPEGLKMERPSKITHMNDTRALHSALKAGDCTWVKLTRLEKEARAKKVKEKMASGEIVPKARKKRADTGMKRGPRMSKRGEKRKEAEGRVAEGSDADEGSPRKKKQRSHAGIARQLPPMPKSKETISDSESNDED
ncbi:hypothetical protein H0H92_007259 [Tricholoma furcatifolium]|nr:hypothetical protein H0H92_007259 [Tricholoma furcatifolium]